MKFQTRIRITLPPGRTEHRILIEEAKVKDKVAVAGLDAEKGITCSGRVVIKETGEGEKLVKKPCVVLTFNNNKKEIVQIDQEAEITLTKE